MMKALVFHGPQQVRVEEVPVPTIADNEVLVKVDACSICGTDVRTYKFGHTRIKGRRITGHEFAGVIAKVGSQVQGLAEGDEVMVVPGINCGTCEFCRAGLENLCQHRTIIGFDYDGAFAEYVRIPAQAVAMGNVKKLPKNVPFKAGALVEPFTAVYNGQTLLNIKPGDRVAIIGAGPIGVMHLLQARNQGAAQVGFVDLNGQRLEEVSRFKPDFTINSSVTDPIEETKRLTGLGFDVVIVSAAAGPAQDQALEMARPAGRVSFFAGLPHDKPHATLNSNALHYKQLSVYGANGSGANQYDTVLRWLSAGLIDLTSVITTELPLEQVEEGFKKVMAGEGLKVVVRPGLA